MSMLQPPLPGITRRGVLITIGGWLVYSALFALYFSAMMAVPLGEAFLGQVSGSIVLGLYGLPVWLIAVRSLDRSAWGCRVLSHLVLGPLYMACAWFTSDLISYALYDTPSVSPDMVVWQLLGLLFTYLIQFGLFHIARSSQKLRWRELQQVELERLLREQQLSVLRSHLNPHFLFNSLNTISAAISQDVELARGLIARLGDVLRYAVDSVDQDFVALADEWKLTRSYLDVEQARLSDRLVIHADIADDLIALPVPPMILQPLAENAIVHGIAPNPDGGQLHLQAQTADGRLQLTVRNSGSPVTGTQPDWEENGTALRNIRARLQALYGDSATFEVEASAEGGFITRLQLPIAPQT